MSPHFWTLVPDKLTPIIPGQPRNICNSQDFIAGQAKLVQGVCTVLSYPQRPALNHGNSSSHWPFPYLRAGTLPGIENTRTRDCQHESDEAEHHNRRQDYSQML